MFGFLRRPDAGFYDLFDRHAELTAEGCRELRALVGDPESAASRARRIKEIEHETDVITHHCVEALHRHTATPIRRDDVHRLITRMDDVMDLVEAAADRITLYELKEMTPEAVQLVDVLVRASAEILHAIKRLRHLSEGRTILDRCIDVNRLENEADEILRRAVARLFKEVSDPIAVIKWKEIYETLENATDRCEDVVNILEGVVLEAAAS